MTVTRIIALAVVAVALVCGAATPSLAEELLHSLYFGALAHDVPDLWSGFQIEQDAVDINLEAKFALAWALPFGVIRPVVGGSINTRGDTSHAYADARWEVEGPSGVFFGLGLGVAIHDGELGPGNIDKKWLGSRALFHIPAEFGIHLGQHSDVSIFFEHVSNANTQTYNEGMDRIGVRYGYRF